MDAPRRSLVSTLRRASLLTADDAVQVLDGLVRALDDERPGADLAAVRTVLSAHLVAIGAVRDARAGDETAVRLVRRAVDAALELLVDVRAPGAGRRLSVASGRRAGRADAVGRHDLGQDAPVRLPPDPEGVGLL